MGLLREENVVYNIDYNLAKAFAPRVAGETSYVTKTKGWVTERTITEQETLNQLLKELTDGKTTVSNDGFYNFASFLGNFYYRDHYGLPTKQWVHTYSGAYNYFTYMLDGKVTNSFGGLVTNFVSKVKSKLDIRTGVIVGFDKSVNGYYNLNSKFDVEGSNIDFTSPGWREFNIKFAGTATEIGTNSNWYMRALHYHLSNTTMRLSIGYDVDKFNMWTHDGGDARELVAVLEVSGNNNKLLIDFNKKLTLNHTSYGYDKNTCLVRVSGKNNVVIVNIGAKIHVNNSNGPQNFTWAVLDDSASNNNKILVLGYDNLTTNTHRKGIGDISKPIYDQGYTFASTSA